MTSHNFTNLDPVVRDKIKNTFQKRVFRLINEGYGRLLNKNKDYSNAIEEDISHDMAEEMEKFLEGDKSPAWSEKFSVHCEKTNFASW